MLKQVMGGRTINTLNGQMSTALTTAVIALLVGEVTEYEEKASGGTVMATIPTTGLNAKRLSVGKKGLNNNFESAFISLPHVKSTKSFNDLKTHMVGNFDSSYETTTACEYCNLYYDKQNKA